MLCHLCVSPELSPVKTVLASDGRVLLFLDMHLEHLDLKWTIKFWKCLVPFHQTPTNFWLQTIWSIMSVYFVRQFLFSAQYPVQNLAYTVPAPPPTLITANLKKQQQQLTTSHYTPLVYAATKETDQGIWRAWIQFDFWTTVTSSKQHLRPLSSFSICKPRDRHYIQRIFKSFNPTRLAMEI